MTAPDAGSAGPAGGGVRPGATGERIAPLVVARGAATGLLLALPAAFLNGVLADQKPKPSTGIVLTYLVVLLGFLLAGWLSGREAPSQVAKHGALAAFAAYIPVEVIALLGRLDRDAPISVFSIVIIGLLAACLGTVGARIGARKRPQGELR